MKMLSLKTLIALVLFTPSLWAYEAKSYRYKVTITNLTMNQVLSPPVVATHAPDFNVFIAGQPASKGVWMIAEDGVVDDLKAELNASGALEGLVAGMNPIKPGTSRTYNLRAKSAYSALSIVTMLVTTNDGFTGLSSAPLPANDATYFVPAWDAGTEMNSESCAHIPGPPCGSHSVRVTDGAEGAIQLHKGINGSADLNAARFGFMQPVAKVYVRRY
jgi:hypothetical protein